AHSLPLQMGVETVRIESKFEADLELTDTVRPPAGSVEGTGPAWVIDPRVNAGALAVNRLLAQGAKVSRYTGHSLAEPGSFIVESIDREILESIAAATHVTL